MTDWMALTEPFPEDVIKTRPGRGGMTFRYVDARVVAQRLDDVLTPEGWDFTYVLEGEGTVHGRLIIGGSIREDSGYPNSHDDDEPIKSAVSDALKRCAVQFGVGRHLYDDNGSSRKPVAQRPAAAQQRPAQAPRAPQAAHRVDTDIMAPEEEADLSLLDDLPFDYPDNRLPVAAGAPHLQAVNASAKCPNHPTREPRQNSKGFYCSAKDPNGKNGFCEWTTAA